MPAYHPTLAARREPTFGRRIIWASSTREIAMKKLMLCAVVAGLMLSSVAAEAKGCIKGAIIGGIAGHYAGHGKVGVVAGCVIGRHEANKADAERAQQSRQAQPSSQNGRI
jgi:hypothetical protein